MDKWIDNIEIGKILIVALVTNISHIFYSASLKGWMVTTLRKGMYGRGIAY